MSAGQLNKLAFPHGEMQIIAIEAMVPGQLYQWGTQTVFVDGIKEHAIGDLVKVCTVGTYRWTTASTTVVALDGNVYYDPADNLMYSGTDTGRFVCGKCRKAKANGDGVEILVEINGA